jgi:hypothetical protein
MCVSIEKWPVAGLDAVDERFVALVHSHVSSDHHVWLGDEGHVTRSSEDETWSMKNVVEMHPDAISFSIADPTVIRDA